MEDSEGFLYKGADGASLLQQLDTSSQALQMTSGLSVYPDYNDIKENIWFSCFKLIKPHAQFGLFHVFETHKESVEPN